MSTNLCSTSSVRAVLGVAETELRDSVLLQPIYLTRLTEDLRSLHASIIADFSTAAALESKSSAQDRFVDLLQTYAAYDLARILLAALPMFAPQTIKDSKSEVTRVADPYARLAQDIKESLPYLKTRLLTAYNAINPDSPLPTATERILVLGSVLGTNPVTG